MNELEKKELFDRITRIEENQKYLMELIIKGDINNKKEEVTKHYERMMQNGKRV